MRTLAELTLAALTLAALLLLCPFGALAHNVPDDVTVRVFMKPAGNTMRILVRVPVNCLIDTLFPMLGATSFLDLPASAEPASNGAQTWISNILTIHESDTVLQRPQVLKIMLSRGTDPSFATFDSALAHLNGPPLPPNALVSWDTGLMDVLLETPIHSDRADFSFVPRFGRLGVKVTNYIAFLPPAGGQRNFVYEGDPPEYRLDPSPGAAARHFAKLGLMHILDETDHVLLLLCLVLLFVRLRALIPFLSAFTVAHSIALLASALIPGDSPAWLPRTVGTLMALFVIYVGLECVVPATPERYRPLIAVSSGLVYGSGFWFFLEPALQYGGSHPTLAALAFNVGIEAGQLLALAVLLPAAMVFFRFAGSRTAWTMVFAGFAAHLAWHRMTERAFGLSRVPFDSPSPEVWAAVLITAAFAIFITTRKEQTLS